MNKTSVNPVELGDAPPSVTDGSPLLAKDMKLVAHVPVSLSVVVGSVSLTVERLFELKKGEVLAMNEALDAPLTVLLNGKAIATGELVAVEDNFGIRITELL